MEISKNLQDIFSRGLFPVQLAPAHKLTGFPLPWPITLQTMLCSPRGHLPGGSMPLISPKLPSVSSLRVGCLVAGLTPQ
jgi:hypothetical protein